MIYELKLSPQTMQAVWAGLLELQAKHALGAINELKPQIEAQESAAAEALTPKPEPTTQP